MRASARTCLLAAFLLGPELVAPLPAHAQSLFLPQAPQGPGGEDSVETASGTRCRQSINSNGAYLDLGLTGHTAGGGDEKRWTPGLSISEGSQGTAYARITLPLGQKPKRLDCSRLHELEIARMKRELELPEMAAEWEPAPRARSSAVSTRR